MGITAAPLAAADVVADDADANAERVAEEVVEPDRAVVGRALLVGEAVAVADEL